MDDDNYLMSDEQVEQIAMVIYPDIAQLIEAHRDEIEQLHKKGGDKI